MKDAVNNRVVAVFDFLLQENIVSKKADIADRLGCSPQTITEILGGRQGVKLNLLQKIFEEFDVAYEFIFQGKKPILNSMRPASLSTKEPVMSIAEYKPTVSIPMVDISVAAGSGFYNPDYLEESEQIYLPAHWAKTGKTYLCVKIKGVSMAPTLQDGGFLIVRMLEKHEWEQIRDGKVYIVADREGRSFVKRVKNRLKQQGTLICISDNPDKISFPNFTLNEEDLNTVWVAEWYFTSQMPDIHASYYNKVSDLEDRFHELKEEFRDMKKQLTK